MALPRPITLQQALAMDLHELQKAGSCHPCPKVLCSLSCSARLQVRQPAPGDGGGQAELLHLPPILSRTHAAQQVLPLQRCLVYPALQVLQLGWDSQRSKGSAGERVCTAICHTLTPAN